MMEAKGIYVNWCWSHEGGMAQAMVQASRAWHLVLEPARYDRLVVAISHLPYPETVALAQVAAGVAAEDALTWQLAASGQDFDDARRPIACFLNDAHMDKRLQSALVHVPLAEFQANYFRAQSVALNGQRTCPVFGFTSLLTGTQEGKDRILKQMVWVRNALGR